VSAVERLCAQWGLTVDPGSPSFGDWNFVLLVHRGSEPCVLKVSGEGSSASEEASALRAWNGEGAALLLESAPEGLLIERLDPSRSLASVPLAEAVSLAGGLARRLAVPAPDGLRALVDVAQEFAESVSSRNAFLGSPLAPSWLERVRTLAFSLAADPGSTLVHGDLHYENILAGSREPWLAIDPKPLAGHPERTVAELLWTRLDEVADIPALVAALTRAGSLDAERTLAWAIVRTADYYLWALSAGLTLDPPRCRRILSALIGPA
jgi:streptomycin 6-kinase